MMRRASSTPSPSSSKLLLSPSSSSSSCRSSFSSCASSSNDIADLNEDEIWGEPMTWEPPHGHGYRWPSMPSVDPGYGASPSPSSSSRGVNIPSEAAISRKHLTRQQSAPMNVPDWSKILGSSAGVGEARNFECDDEEGEGSAARIPPHELVARDSARSHSLAFSVGEGIGLKGRNLSRVRNAVLKQTGFL